jgi:hypothetical protein
MWFLEFCRVGRAVDDGVDAEERRAARLNGWKVWEAEEGVAESTQPHTFIFSSCTPLFVKVRPIPRDERTAHL